MNLAKIKTHLNGTTRALFAARFFGNRLENTEISTKTSCHVQLPSVELKFNCIYIDVFNLNDFFNVNTWRDQVAVNLAKIKTHLNGTTKPLESFMKNPHRSLLTRGRKAGYCSPADKNSQRKSVLILSFLLLYTSWYERWNDSYRDFRRRFCGPLRLRANRSASLKRF